MSIRGSWESVCDDAEVGSQLVIDTEVGNQFVIDTGVAQSGPHFLGTLCWEAGD